MGTETLNYAKMRMNTTANKLYHLNNKIDLNTLNLNFVHFKKVAKLQFLKRQYTIGKAKKALFAIRLLKRYFNQSQIRTLLDSNFYSVLYYNAVIWLTPNLSSDLKQSLLSISANALSLEDLSHAW